MYYSDEIIEEVRNRNDIVDVVSAYVKLKRSGSTFFGLCPFHNEKSASFSVTPGKQMYYCFGCHKGGSVYTFIQEIENVTFPESVQILAERVGIELPAQAESSTAKREHALREQILEINKMAATYYYYQLREKGGKVGLEYLENRGLSEDIMRQFGLGFAGQNDKNLYAYLHEKNISDEMIYKAGLVNLDERRGPRDKFWNRVIFPIMDVSNRVIGFGGRVMGDGKPKYLNSPENEVFNKRRNLYGLNIARRSRKGRLILCEGYMDVISMHQAGFSNAVASLGTALTEEHAALLKRFTSEVVLSYDSDSAGINAALRAIPMLKAEGIRVKILHLEPYKDPDEFIKGLGAEELEKRINDAQNSFFFEIDVLRNQYQLSDPEERTIFQKETASRIAAMSTDAERENYIQACAEKYMIPVDALRDLVRLSLMQGVQQPKRRVKDRDYLKKSESSSGLMESERRLLTWLTEYKDFYQILKEYIKVEDYSTPFYRDVAKLLYEQMEQGKLNQTLIIDHFAASNQDKEVAALFYERADTHNDEELQRAMKETIKKVFDEANRRKADSGGAVSWDELIKTKNKVNTLQNLHIDLVKMEE